MNLSIQQVSDDAHRSTMVGNRALAQAQVGAEAVQNTIEGMGRIRSQVQMSADRVGTLNESSQEIENIVTVIKSIADRIGILALNASIQASAAGPAGVGFAVVAEEVERLSELSTSAAQEIESRLSNINTEVQAAADAMEKTLAEVDSGAELAVEAGKTLREIETVSTEMAQVIESISAETVNQAQTSEMLARSMSEIADDTLQTAAGTREASQSIAELADLADSLRDSVTTFKIGAVPIRQRKFVEPVN